MAIPWIRSFIGGTQFSRAERHLRSAELELDAIPRSDENAADMTTAARLLEESRAAITAGKVEHCWHLLNGANRIIVSRREPTARTGAARVLLIEADKLSSQWRRKAIASLLEADEVPQPWALVDALWLRDDYHETRYQRIAMQREQLTMLLAVSSAALVAILAIAASVRLGREALDAWDWPMLALVILFGMLGASFSAARSITKEALKTEIPELVLSKWITLARTVLGACPGLALYAFLQSGLLNLPNFTMAQALAVAFAGGFSERLIVKAVESVTGPDKPA